MPAEAEWTPTALCQSDGAPSLPACPRPKPQILNPKSYTLNPNPPSFEGIAMACVTIVSIFLVSRQVRDCRVFRQCRVFLQW